MRVNLIVVYNFDTDKILMCFRAKDPYKGLFNFVGGKLEKEEDGLMGAYRELLEETGITKDDIVLSHLMDMQYHCSDYQLEVFVGRLNKDLELQEEVNKLHWFSVENDFFDMSKFAGEGSVGHIIEQVKIYKNILLK